MARSLKISKSVGGTTKVGKIGATALGGNQIQVAYRTGGTNYTGWITKQVSARRFKCTDGSHPAICTLTSSLVNNGDMTVTATRSTAATFTVEKITNKHVTDFSGNLYAWNFTTAAAASGLELEVVTLAAA